MRRSAVIAVVAVLAVLCIAAGVSAETLDLPSDLKRIESRAFADLRADEVRFPNGIEYIAEDAFEGAVFIGTGSRGSYTERWCWDHGLAYYASGASGALKLACRTNGNGFVFTGENGSESNPEDRMAHNIYVDPDLSATSGKFMAFTVDFLAEDAPPCTYWSLCNWEMDTSELNSRYPVTDRGHVYAGLQMTDMDVRTVGIMSFWEIHYTKDGRDTILNAKRIYPPGEHTFDGEGEGTNNISHYPWKENHWYRMTIQCHDDEDGYTIVEQWFMDVESGEWTFFCQFNTGLQHSYMTGEMSQFMENFVGSYSNEFRSFRYRNMWVQEYDTQEWKPITKAMVSTDTWWDNKKGYYSFGADGNSVWGVTCGYGTDVTKTHPDVITSMYCDVPGDY